MIKQLVEVVDRVITEGMHALHVPYHGRGGTQLHQQPLQNRPVGVPQNAPFPPQNASPLPTPSQSRPDKPNAFGEIQMCQILTENGGFPEDD